MAQIGSSLALVADELVAAVTSGANRVDTRELATLRGVHTARMVDPDEVTDVLGYEVPPFGQDTTVQTYPDETLPEFDTVAAAGSPETVSPVAPDRLVEITGATVATLVAEVDVAAFLSRSVEPTAMTTLIYGAYGYTGELVAEEAIERRLDVILAGRNGTKTRGLATMLGTDARVFDAGEARDHLDDVDTLLNCAGPFVETYEPLVEACLDTDTHYLDITGEFSVFEALAERDREAEQAGICVLPGVGFDVVPTDCLAGHLHDRLADADDLSLGFDALGAVSGGTVASAIEHASGGGKVRRDGRIESVPVASQSRTIDFGRGARHAVTVPWGDVSTAYYTTGIENVEVYVPMPPRVARFLRLAAPMTGLLGVGPVKRGLQALARRTFGGPSADQRASDRAYIWGEATNGEQTVVSRLETPEPYTLTVDAATTAIERFESEPVPTGFHTPAAAFDPEFVLELDAVEGFADD